MLSKGIMQDNKPAKNCKQFVTCTGSPIIYTKFRKARGIYYPVAKPHKCSWNVKKGKKLKRCCIVYSRMYGREIYGNIDIWPDEGEREKLVRINEDITHIPDDECDCDDHGEDSLDTLTDYSTDKTENIRPDDVTTTDVPGGKHVTITVTDTSALGSPDSTDRQIHPALDRPNSPTQGTWPLKRSQSVDSRENPFLPGGDLSREADDILARAKIVRDTFILDEERKAETSQISPERSRDTRCEHPNRNEDENNKTPVNETFTPETAANAETTPLADTRPKENGQLDTDDSLSPGSVKMELIDDNKDKKKHKKCCTIM